jgi:hypothetical protein
MPDTKWFTGQKTVLAKDFMRGWRVCPNPKRFMERNVYTIY